MGCTSSKPAEAAGKEPSPRPRPRDAAGFACFLSHYKVEAATEARWLQQELEAATARRCFLDSDDLKDLSRLRDHVRESACVLMVQTRSILTRPYCVVELVTAIDAGVPIVGVSVASGAFAYDFAEMKRFMTHLDHFLGADARAALAALGVDAVDAAYKLSNCVPNVISVPLNMNESRTVLSARVADIVSAMDGKTARAALPDKDAWLASRGVAGAAPLAGAAPHQPGAVGGGPAPVPPEVPVLPDSAVGRPEIIAALKARVLHTQQAGTTTAVTAPALAKKRGSGIGGFCEGLAANLTSTTGMGGVGKTVTVAALARDDEVRYAFDKICWVSVGQEPDVPALQQTLHIQLVGRPLPEAAQADERVAHEALKEAAGAATVLLVLDDVWLASHATPLNFVQGACRSAVVITTRMRSLLDGASEVQCNVLSAEASLELLLRAGGCEELLDSRPEAALEAVEYCGRLPLALGLAGGIIKELADSWQHALIPLLQEELGGEFDTVEERVVTASLRAVPQEMRADVGALFALFALFAEDAVVPAAAIDVIAPLAREPATAEPERLPAARSAASASGGGAALQKRAVRRSLQQLIKSNVLRGSIERGVSVHDLVRDCMIRRAERAREGGLRAMQREAVPLLLAAFDAGGPAAGYVSGSLYWHVRQALDPKVEPHADAVLMSVLTHEKGDVRKQGATGIGVDRLRSSADTCDAAGEHLEAAQLMFAVVAVRATAAGSEAMRAWASLKRLEEAGRGSAVSHALESQVLNNLCLSDGGIAYGSAEHTEMLERIKALGALATSDVELQMSADANTGPSKEAMEAEVGLYFAALFAIFALEGISAWESPMTHEMLVQSHHHMRECVKHDARAAALAPDPAAALAVWSYITAAVYMPRQHALAEFAPESLLGRRGARLRETIEQYDFDSVHLVTKQMASNVDVFSFGAEPLGLLLWWGDVSAARAGFAKVLDVHKRMLARVRHGEIAADGYAFETFCMVTNLPGALLAAGDTDMLRELMANSLAGAILDDETVRAGFATFYDGPFGQWKTADGHCHHTFGTYQLVVRGLEAMIRDGAATDASRAALRAWLPPPAELLRIAEKEGAWRAHACAVHPALLCARLHGERLGDWAAAAEVAEGVLATEAFNPVVRTEALRLLGRAWAAQGAQAAACEAAERAVAQAAEARYAWFEMLALADLLKWCAAGEAADVRSRLRGVASRLASSKEELAGVIGEGAL